MRHGASTQPDLLALSPLPGDGFFRLNRPSLRSPSLGPPGIIPDPYGLNLADKARFSKEKSGLSQDDASGDT